MNPRIRCFVALILVHITVAWVHYNSLVQKAHSRALRLTKPQLTLSRKSQSPGQRLTSSFKIYTLESQSRGESLRLDLSATSLSKNAAYVDTALNLMKDNYATPALESHESHNTFLSTTADGDINISSSSDPELLRAISDEESRLRRIVAELNEQIRCERVKSSNLRDKISESGKLGYKTIQAQISQIQMKMNLREKDLLMANKKKIAELVIPIIDRMRGAKELIKAETEREEKLHANLMVVLSSLLIALENDGFEEFNAEIGSPVDQTLHSISRTVLADKPGIIIEQIHPGIVHKSGEIIRRALVIATAKENL